MEWKKLTIVLHWEFFQRVRSRSFLFSLIFVPLVFFIFTVLPTSLIEQPSGLRLGVTGFSDWQTSRLSTWVSEEVSIVPLPPDARTTPQTYSEWCDGLLVMEETYPRLIVFDAESSQELQSVVNNLLMRTRLEGEGFAGSRLDRIVQSVPVELLGEPADGMIKKYRAAVTIVMMLFFAMFNSSGAFLRTLSEERHSRITEVLVASIDPVSLMAGKILGLAGVGLLQLAVWSVLGLIWGDLAFFDLLSWTEWLLIVIYFLLGYMFYTGMFAGIGSVLSSESDVQHVQAVLSILGLLPAGLLVVILSNPDSSLVRWITYLPFVTPTLMPLRIILSEVSMFSIAVTLVLMTISSAAMIMMAGRLFSTSRLLSGSAPATKGT